MPFRSLYERRALWDQPSRLTGQRRRAAAGLTGADADGIVAGVQAQGGQEALERLRDAVRSAMPDDEPEAARRRRKAAKAVEPKP